MLQADEEISLQTAPVHTPPLLQQLVSAQQWGQLLRPASA